MKALGAKLLRKNPKTLTSGYHYTRRSADKRRRGWWLKVLVVVALLAVGAGGLLVFRGDSKTSVLPTSSKQTSAVSVAQQTKIDSIAGRYLLNGTVVWARAVERYSQRADGTYDYTHPFSQLDTFNRAAYDAWSTDFECPITNNVVPYQQQIDNLVFNCRPEFLPEAAKYFSLFDLANNHTDNQNGTVGLSETRQHLDATPGAQYFGNFDPSVANDVCEVVALPVRLEKPDKTEIKAALPVAMCAWHYLYRTPLPGEIAVMQRYAKIMPVFAFVEMGTEYQPKANAIQVQIAHEIVDQGPEFLIANNPHWVQNTEVYKGKLIVYSTGNFIFDQLDTETQRSASIDVTLIAPYDANAAKWVALAPSCAKFHDSCLATAEQQSLTKMKLGLRYAVVAGQGGAGKVTHRADASTQAAVELRMNWSDTLKQLGQ